MCSGICPPSKPTSHLVAGLRPLVPRPAVLPLEPSPRPTRVLAVLAPGTGRRWCTFSTPGRDAGASAFGAAFLAASLLGGSLLGPWPAACRPWRPAFLAAALAAAFAAAFAAAPWGPSPPPRRRPSSQPSRPLVDLLNLHEVGDGLDVTARLRVVGTDDRVADPLQTEAAQRVTLVLLLAHLGLVCVTFSRAAIRHLPSRRARLRPPHGRDGRGRPGRTRVRDARRPHGAPRAASAPRPSRARC